MTRREDPSRAVALDLMLRTFMNTSEFNDMQPKNWDAIAKLIPGTMPQECAQRFEELQSAAGDLSHVGNFSTMAAQGKPAPRGKTAENSGRRAYNRSHGRPNSSLQQDSKARGKAKQQETEGVTASNLIETKEAKNLTQGKIQKETSGNKGKSEGPNIVIHVCDEAKNVKRDFSCPRDLLVREMKYFAEYLSLDAQRWEEVDISVHCDVQIFEWLMRYVHRHIPERVANVPKLEANNVISILISSDFLKMDALVNECIDFCHKHMSAIVSTPCNMNCINDKLVTRISSLFTNVEADEVKDKKDKFKSKLFMKKIENLCDSSKPTATMYKCQHCKRILTRMSERKLRCIPSRLSIDRTGKLLYHHERLASWDINDYLIALHNELKSWRDVYWRLWGQLNILKCSRCKQVFQCSEFTQCHLHPQNAVFVNSVDNTFKASVVGSYPCCEQPAYRFDPLEQVTGCQVKDHLVTFTGLDKSDSAKHDSETSILDTLLDRKDVICAGATLVTAGKWSDANIFSADEVLSGVLDEGLGVKGHLHDIFPDDNMPFAKHIEAQPEPVASSTDDWDSSDDEVGDDEEQTKGRGSYRKVPISRKQSSKSTVGREKQVRHTISYPI
nr:SANT and BTB domain regulator of class switch recombination-like [Lytechinus pictus]XP_054749189.1 SANT and BTB domain regulator of class switch recombination-like [Lytechinus pictus]